MQNVQHIYLLVSNENDDETIPENREVCNGSERKKNVTNAIVLMAAAVATATERSKAVCIKILRECTFKMRLSTLKS